jgi:hypothetical protein
MNGVKQQSGTGSVETGKQENRIAEQRELTGYVGPLKVNWPRAAGYYGGLGVALTLGIIEAPLGIFIAAVPLFKMLNRPDAPQGMWVAGEVLQGASTPIGGSASPVVRIRDDHRPGGAPGALGRLMSPLKEIWTEAQEVAHSDGARG